MKRLLTLGLGIVALCVVSVSVIAWREQEKSLRRANLHAKEQKQRQFEGEVLNRVIVLAGQRLTPYQLAEELAKQTDLKVVVAEAAKQEYGAGSIGFRLNELPRGRYSLRSLVAWLEVDEPALWLEFNEDKLTITTTESAMSANHLQTVVYPLPQPEPAGMREEDWRELIQETAMGWRGNYIASRVGDVVVEAIPGAVIVVHHTAGQRKVRWIMDALAKLGEREASGMLWPPQGADSQRERIRAALNEKSSCRFENTPLEEAMEQMAAQHGINIYLRAEKLDEASVPVTTPITKNVAGISLRSLLNLIVRDLELTYTVEDQGLVITTPENAEDHEIIVAYDVGDIVEKFGNSPDATDWDSLVEVIYASVRPDSWNGISGPGPSMGYGDRWLIFPQTEAVHEQVVELLDQMRWVKAGKAGEVPPSLRATKEIEERIRTALRRVIELDKEPRPLNDAVSRLRDVLGIPILVDEKRLMEAGVGLDAPVVTDLGAATAGAHLAAMLQAVTLTTVMRDEVLQITTPEDEESYLVTRVYDARPLLQKALSEERLCDLIRAKIRPGKWHVNSGPGNVESYAGSLVVNHTPAVQEELERYLEKLGISLGERKAGSAGEEEPTDGK